MVADLLQDSDPEETNPKAGQVCHGDSGGPLMAKIGMLFVR